MATTRNEPIKIYIPQKYDEHFFAHLKPLLTQTSHKFIFNAQLYQELITERSHKKIVELIDYKPQPLTYNFKTSGILTMYKHNISDGIMYKHNISDGINILENLQTLFDKEYNKVSDFISINYIEAGHNRGFVQHDLMVFRTMLDFNLEIMKYFQKNLHNGLSI